jgi:hypothetical protein
VSDTWQQDLLDVLEDAEVRRVERRRKCLSIHLSRLSIRGVQHILLSLAKCCRSTVSDQLVEDILIRVVRPAQGKDHPARVGVILDCPVDADRRRSPLYHTVANALPGSMCRLSSLFAVTLCNGSHNNKTCGRFLTS